MQAQAVEVLKLLSLLEIFAHNRLNLVCIKQIQGADVLVELLKYFASICDDHSFLDQIELRLLTCLGLLLRHDRLGTQLIGTF